MTRALCAVRQRLLAIPINQVLIISRLVDGNIRFLTEMPLPKTPLQIKPQSQFLILLHFKRAAWNRAYGIALVLLSEKLSA